MKHSWMMIALPLALAGCGDSNDTQSDPVNDTPPTQSGNPAPADRDPTPQTGTGGDSSSTAPTGTTTNPPANSTGGPSSGQP
jgi:hypothetical protein